MDELIMLRKVLGDILLVGKRCLESIRSWSHCRISSTSFWMCAPYVDTDANSIKDCRYSYVVGVAGVVFGK